MWLAPHFEKMLYDNALLIAAYTKAYEITKNSAYKTIVEKTIEYINREMTHPNGGFYSAQDADSDGVEGKYYVFTPGEIITALGEDAGRKFCCLYDITEDGNFEGKNIPNQINHAELYDSFIFYKELYEYRKKRTELHTDDKILTAWNGLMIAALADAGLVLGSSRCLEMAERAVRFIENKLSEDNRVYTGFRDADGREVRTDSGFLDDYAFFIHGLLRLYHATLDTTYLELTESLCQRVVSDFFDNESGGFFLTGLSGETLITRPKETYDGATPSGNSVMTLNLLTLNLIDGKYEEQLGQQMDFMTARAAEIPAGHSFFLYCLLKKDFPERKIVVVPAADERDIIPDLCGKGWIIILDNETDEYKLKDGKTTYYICENKTCLPAGNELF
jgi:hypothetical protein